MTPAFYRLVKIGHLATTLETVPRATVTPWGTAESVAAHTVHVAIIAAWLAQVVGEDVGQATLEAVLHDLPEAICGDIDSRDLTWEEWEAKRVAEHAAEEAILADMVGYSFAPMRRALRPEHPGVAHLADKIAPKLVNHMSGGAQAARDLLTYDDYVRMHRRQEEDLFEPGGKLGVLLARVGPEHASTLRAIFRAACELSESVVNPPEEVGGGPCEE